MPDETRALTEAERLRAGIRAVLARLPQSAPGPARDPVWGDWVSHGNYDDVASDAVAEAEWAVATSLRELVGCPRCDGEAWVCENHLDRPSEITSQREDVCGCGAGAPCPDCNGMAAGRRALALALARATGEG